jgi:hypothetical protein
MELFVTYTLLENSFTQSLTPDQSHPLGFSSLDAVSLFTSTSFLYSLGIMISVVAAGFMYARAGLWRMEASERGVRKSNEEIKRTTLGLLGILSLFVIIYTFNKDLLTGDVSLKDLKASSIVSGKGGDFGGGGASGDFSTSTQTSGSEEANRKVLGDAGITFNHEACTGSSGVGCTNVGGINPSSITMLLKLRSDCGCAIQITGGTEPGHSTNSNHGVGKEAVDISLTTELSNFLKSHGTSVGNTPPCNIRYGYAGFIFWDEAQGCDSIGGVRHFHASFTGR